MVNPAEMAPRDSRTSRRSRTGDGSRLQTRSLTSHGTTLDPKLPLDKIGDLLQIVYNQQSSIAVLGGMHQPVTSKDVTSPLTNVLAPPEKRVLAEDVATRLRTAILKGHFSPGERLREERLAQALDVSRGPVREALAQLERQGLVVINRNRGAIVAQLAREDLDELYTLRLALEVLAVERAARFADATLDQLFDAVISKMVSTFERGMTEAEAAELDLELHDLIYAAANHRRLQETWATIRPQIHILLLNRNVAHGDFREMLITSHQDLVGAIHNRDEVAAVTFIREHLAGSYERVVRSMNIRDPQVRSEVRDER